MRSRSATLGVLFATTTAVVWGGQFVVGKSALESVNAFPLSTVRYALGGAAVARSCWPSSKGRPHFGWAAGLAALLARLARLRRVQPARLHRPRARAAGDGVAHRRARPAAHGSRALAADGAASRPRNVRPARGRALRGRARRQRGHPELDRARADRVGRGARPRGSLQLRALQPRRRRVPDFSRSATRRSPRRSGG